MKLLPPRWFDELPSTNTWLLERLRAGGTDAPSAGVVIAARRQTAGRGRRGRIWRSAEGRDLAVSLVAVVPSDPRRAGSLAMALALGIADWGASLGARVAVKWPNDVLIAGPDGTWGKWAGLLVEQAGDFLVAGAGINLSPAGAAADADAGAAYPARALPPDIATPTPEAALVALCASSVWPHRIADWRRDGFEGLRAEWMTRVTGLGELLPGSAEVLEGFGPHGEARVRGTEGKVRMVWGLA